MSTNHEHDTDDHSARVRTLDLERGSKTSAGTRPPDPTKHLWVEPYTASVERALHPGDSLTVVNRTFGEIRVCTGERVRALTAERDELKAERDAFRDCLEYVRSELAYLQELWGREGVTTRIEQKVRACVEANHAGAINDDEDTSP